MCLLLTPALDLICILLLYNIYISDIISKIPKARDVIQLLADVAYQWREIGESLEVQYGHLMSIQYSNQSNIQSLYQVIQIWLDQSDNPTWTKLILAFEEPPLQNRRMANTIREYLSRPDVYEKYVSY